MSISTIPIGAKVICSDGSRGRTTAIIVDPASRTLTHIAVSEHSLLHGEERLVPIDRVMKTTRDEVHLSCTKDELSGMKLFTRTHYLEMDAGEDGYAFGYPYMTTYTDGGLSPELGYLTVQEQLVPEGKVAINPGTAVEAVDGYAGQVGELLIDPQSGKVTHFLLKRGRRWSKKEVAVDIGAIEHVEDYTIKLKLSKADLDQLPSLPVKRAWEDVYATDLELVVWVFDQKDAAQTTLDYVHELSKQYAIELLNSTVIEKSAKGDIHIHENKKAPTKRRVALGIALGGLAGLVVGPVALAAGVIAGAVAGKKSAKKVEVGFSEEKLRRLNDCLSPGGSALVLLIEHRWFHTLQVELADKGGQLIHERLSDVTYDELLDELDSVQE